METTAIFLAILVLGFAIIVFALSLDM